MRLTNDERRHLQRWADGDVVLMPGDDHMVITYIEDADTTMHVSERTPPDEGVAFRTASFFKSTCVSPLGWEFDVVCNDSDGEPIAFGVPRRRERTT